MSAQLVLTDAEMEALQRCIRIAHEGADESLPLDEAESAAATRAYDKFIPHLNRKSRRRAR